MTRVVKAGRIAAMLALVWFFFAFPYLVEVPAQVQETATTSPSVSDVSPGEFEPESDNAIFRSATRTAPSTKARLQAEFSPDEKQSINDNCVLGMPKVDPGAGLGVIKIVVREGYVLGHSSRDKIPYWVCEHSTPEELTGPGDRDKSKFLPDPLLRVGSRAELRDYKGSGFDRGHMHPAANAKQSQQMMNETHYLSNMVPQFGPTFNRGVWAELEDTVRTWTKDHGETWIISGPLFYDPLEDDPQTADGVIPYTTIGDNEVAVPTHCHKIVLAKDESDKWIAIAFVFENRRYGRPYRLPLYITTIDWIEERAGLNFFPDLDADPQMESDIEGKKSAMWN